MSRCDLTDLPADMCAHCLGHKDTEQQATANRDTLLARGNWLAAKFPGRCSGCGEWYQPSTVIRRDGDGWLAECCSEEER